MVYSDGFVSCLLILVVMVEDLGSCLDFLDKLLVFVSVVFGVFGWWQFLNEVVEEEFDELELDELIVGQEEQFAC